MAGLSAQVAINHGGTGSVNGVMTLLFAATLWAFGMVLTVGPIVESFSDLAGEIA